MYCLLFSAELHAKDKKQGLFHFFTLPCTEMRWDQFKKIKMKAMAFKRGFLATSENSSGNQILLNETPWKSYYTSDLFARPPLSG